MLWSSALLATHLHVMSYVRMAKPLKSLWRVCPCLASLTPLYFVDITALVFIRSTNHRHKNLIDIFIRAIIILFLDTPNKLHKTSFKLMFITTLLLLHLLLLLLLLVLCTYIILQRRWLSLDLVSPSHTTLLKLKCAYIFLHSLSQFFPAKFLP